MRKLNEKNVFHGQAEAHAQDPMTDWRPQSTLSIPNFKFGFIQ